MAPRGGLRGGASGPALLAGSDTQRRRVVGAAAVKPRPPRQKSVEAAPTARDVEAAVDTLRTIHDGVTVETFRDLRWELLQSVGEFVEAGQRVAAERANRAVRVLDAHHYHSQPRFSRDADLSVLAAPRGCTDRSMSALWGLTDSVAVWRVLLLPTRVLLHLLVAVVVPLFVAATAWLVAPALGSALGWPRPVDVAAAAPEQKLALGVAQDVVWAAPLLLLVYPLQYVSLTRLAESSFETRWRVRGAGSWSVSVLPSIVAEVAMEGSMALLAVGMHSAVHGLPHLAVGLLAMTVRQQHRHASEDTAALLHAANAAAHAFSWVLRMLCESILFSYLAFGLRLERQDLLTPGRKLRQVERCWHYFACFTGPFCVLRSVAVAATQAAPVLQRAALLGLSGAALPFFVVAASNARARRWQHAPWQTGPPFLRPAHVVLAALAPAASGRGST